MRKPLAVLVALAAVALAAPAGLADPLFPELDVFTYDQGLGVSTTLSLDATLLAGQPNADTIAITVPTGYSLALPAVGTPLGDAEVDAVPAAGGTTTALKGTAVVVDPAAFAADPQTAACAPGTHVATWSLSLGSATVPIAVDAAPAGGSYLLTECLDGLRAANLKPVDVWVLLKDVFTNPATPQTYWWRALVTPVDANGAPAPTAAYELQGAEPIPEILTVRSTWNAKTHYVTVRGSLVGGAGPRSGIHVHVFAGASSDYAKLREIGYATTSAAGTYVFRQHRATRPAYVYGHVNFYHGDHCTQPSTAPAGCLGWSIDGTDSPTVKTR